MMKKMLAAAVFAAAFSTTAKSEITSSNCVGYDTVAMESGTTAASVCDFLRIGNEDAVALRDITPKSVNDYPFSLGNFFLIPVSTDGGSPMIIDECDWLWDDEELNEIEGWGDFLTENCEKDIHFSYLNGKWYLEYDSEMKYEVSRFEFPAGVGFIVYVGGSHWDGLTLGYAGQVADADLPIDFESGTTGCSGNFAPVEMALSEFLPESINSYPFSLGNFFLIPISTDGGSPMIIDECDWLWDDEELNEIEGWGDFLTENCEKDIHFSYLNGKWYLEYDSEMKYEVSRFPFRAAEGFIVYVGGSHWDGLTLTLPNALK